jgi:copper chaperone CopZ
VEFIMSSPTVRPVVFAFLACALAISTACEKTKPDSMAVVSPELRDSVVTASPAAIFVHGMSCPLCANNIDKQLLDVNGVTSVDVNLNDGLVLVHVAPGAATTYGQIADAVERSGFTLVRIEGR